VVNIALLVIRRRPYGDDESREHFRAPRLLPWVGALTCAFLAGPWARNDEQLEQYRIALYLLVVGVVLWLITWFFTRGDRQRRKNVDLTKLDS
jgi:hypothetical protein